MGSCSVRRGLAFYQTLRKWKWKCCVCGHIGCVLSTVINYVCAGYLCHTRTSGALSCYIMLSKLAEVWTENIISCCLLLSSLCSVPFRWDFTRPLCFDRSVCCSRKKNETEDNLLIENSEVTSKRVLFKNRFGNTLASLYISDSLQ